jgi:hypothetical protein
MRSRFVCVAASILFLSPVLAASAADPQLDAEVVDADVNSANGNALIRVAVTGVQLIDADDAGSTPRIGQGHLHYQVDDGPVIATSASKLAFHELKPGEHQIRVTLVGNDHKPTGPEETVTVMIPSAVLAQ